MPDETQPVKRKYVRKAQAEGAVTVPLGALSADEVAVAMLHDPQKITCYEAGATILEVRLTIPPDLPGMGGMTTLNVTDPLAKSKGLVLSLHRIGVLATYGDGSFVGVFPYSQIKRIRFDRVPD